MVRSNLNLRKSPLRWTPQQPSKVATVSQIAAPQSPMAMGKICAAKGGRAARWRGGGIGEAICSLVQRPSSSAGVPSTVSPPTPRPKAPAPRPDPRFFKLQWDKKKLPNCELDIFVRCRPGCLCERCKIRRLERQP